MTVETGAIRRLLVANRGEIALRIQRACRDLGIEVIQVYSQADRDSLPVARADGSICIGGAPSSESYLSIGRLLDAARLAKADAIHPGYGFLSENASFAQACEDAGVIFVGPPPQAIAAMGDKAAARRIAAEAGVPITPGTPGTIVDVAEARTAAQALGYPVLLKAIAGGGGRGMRVVRTSGELDRAFADAAREALAAFGDAGLYLEKFLERVRHVEIQVLGDGEATVHLGERDCSIQRRSQKLLEETPSPGLDEGVRAAMGEAAIRICNRVGYRSAGTIEFIVDAARGAFHFMEMNTRIQVEHPVTEEVTGIDIVKAQIRVAGGARLGFAQGDVRPAGHALECRINAEDPERGFAPCPGVVGQLHWPDSPGIRVDSHLYAGYRVPPYYDSLLAKLIARGKNRAQAIDRMRRALSELKLTGVPTTAGFHARLLADERFLRGEAHTRFIEDEFAIQP